MKKIFSVLIALVIVFQAVALGGAFGAQESHAAEAVCGVENVSVKYGSETVRVPIYLENNPGVISVALEIYYSTTYLTLSAVEYNDSCGLGTNIGSDNLAQYPFKFIMGNDAAKENCTFNGVIAELIFEISEDAPALGYNVEIVNDYTSGVFAMNANLAEVGVTAKNGSIRILPEETTPTPGPTATPVPTATPEPTLPPGSTPTAVPTGDPTPVPTATPVPSDKVTSAPEPTVTAEPTNVPVTTATPAPETDGPDGNTNEPSQTPSSASPSETDGVSDTGDKNSTDAPSASDGEENKAGCKNAIPAITVIIVLAVACAVGLVLVWLKHKKS